MQSFKQYITEARLLKIWLDDIRPEPKGWVRAYWPEEVITLLKTKTVDEISLDHDLGDDNHGTGYDVLKWIEEMVHTSDFTSPKISVHSANSVAVSKMKAAITSIERKASSVNEMTRRLKEISKAASTNDVEKMQKLGRVDYELTGKHLTAKNGKVVHRADMKTIAVVPGAFKPPTGGHLDMVMKYAKRADEVIIIISDPKSSKSQRKTARGKVISAEDSLNIWNIYLQRYGLRNVQVVISPSPSPVTAAFEYAEKQLKDVNVIFGASTKGGDHKRWATAEKYFEKANPTIVVLNPERTAVKPLTGPMGDISATDVRNNANDIEMLKKLLPKKLNDGDIKKIQEILI
jgi:cytidyltransferase-like protein